MSIRRYIVEVVACAAVGTLTAGGVLYAASDEPQEVVITVEMPTPTWADPGITEDDAKWNCLTMGNGICGPEWVFVPQELGDALAEGDDTAPENAADRNWEACVIKYDETSIIACPDGFVTTS